MLRLFARLSKREKIIAYSLLGLVSFLFFEGLVLRPVSQRLDVLKGKIAEQEKQLIRSLSILEQKDLINQEYNQYVKERELENSNQEVLMDFQKNLEDLARKTRVYVGNMRPLEVENKQNYRKYTVEVDAQATIVHLTDFLFQLEREPQLMRVSEFSLSPTRNNPALLEFYFAVTKIKIDPNTSD